MHDFRGVAPGGQGFWNLVEDVKEVGGCAHGLALEANDADTVGFRLQELSAWGFGVYGFRVRVSACLKT